MQAASLINIGKRFNHQIMVGVVYFDNLPDIQEALGYNKSDNLLALLGEALKNQFNETDVIGVAGAGEFLIASLCDQTALNWFHECVNNACREVKEWLSLSFDLFVNRDVVIEKITSYTDVDSLLHKAHRQHGKITEE